MLKKVMIMIMEYIGGFEPLRFCAKTMRYMFIISYVTVATPALYNMGSAEIGCPVYELRTGQTCEDILKH